MDYPLISADDHLDLQYLPPDLWTTRLPKSLRDRAPHVEDRDGGSVWVCEGGVWGRWAGRRRPAGPKSAINAFDRSHVDESELRPAKAELRLADMDRDGVEAQVMYGPVTSMIVPDPTLRTACVQVYNDWLLEFCSAAPRRLLGVAILPPEDPTAARDEVYRLAKRGGLRQANLQIFEETGLLLSFHVVVFGAGGAVLGMPAGLQDRTASAFNTTKLFMDQFLDPFVDLFAWGIFERHPKLKLVMAESGVGWLPWIVQELDYRFWRLYEAREYWDQRGGIDLTIKPSELFRRQVWVSFQDDEVAMSLLPFYGDGHLLWASDYPHPDSTWPNSRRVIDKQMAGLSPEVRKQLTRDNAATLYGL
ncbi:MAG: amidohydrolase [Candidatus Rokuibacteriota bacterium]|nr:MAG: amidohydrolase [Candidatus Rokubacteria bacterium]